MKLAKTKRATYLVLSVLVLSLGILNISRTTSANSSIGFAWSYAGPIAGKFCISMNETAEPAAHSWSDNYLCTPSNIGLRWNTAGPIPGMVCTQFLEIADPDTWNDNYLCAPTDLGLIWHSAGPLAGMDCTQINEPSDPDTWNDNYLCEPLAAPPPPANTKPYFKEWGGDVMSGGWFGNGCATNSNYQDTATSPASDKNGGILAFGNHNASENPTGGASSQYAAYSIGKIEKNDSINGYFYSNSAQGGGALAYSLSFANDDTASAPIGGLFQGSSRQNTNCIPDYYGLRSSEATTDITGTGISTATASGAYKATAAVFTLSGANVQVAQDGLGKGKSIRVYVNGSVYINHNITYNLDTVDNVPKFALIVKGDIYIDPGVTNLDGMYVAEPTNLAGNNGGNIWTCHDGSTTNPDGTWLKANCNSAGLTLGVNGALIAKQINLVRLQGDIAGASNADDGLSGLGSSNIAEKVNYSPAMVIGGGFFPANTQTPIQSIQSLPPIF